jgi:hypothetical protein
MDEQGWKKSSYSGGQGGNCVEVAARPTGEVGVRDSKDPTGPMLSFTREAWRVFTGSYSRGLLGSVSGLSDSEGI